MSEVEQPADPCIAPVAGCRVAVSTSRSLQVCGIVQGNGRATSLMSPGPCPTRSSSFTSLRRSPTALNNQACSLSDCPTHQPARERLAVLRSKSRRKRWRLAGAGGHERSRAVSRSRGRLATCSIPKPARQASRKERLAVLRSEVKEEALAISQCRGT